MINSSQRKGRMKILTLSDSDLLNFIDMRNKENEKSYQKEWRKNNPDYNKKWKRSKTAGISFQELLAAMALLTKQGISTDMATTALRATIVALTKTTPESAKVFKELGIETGITAIRSNGLGKTLGQVMNV